MFRWSGAQLQTDFPEPDVRRPQFLGDLWSPRFRSDPFGWMLLFGIYEDMNRNGSLGYGRALEIRMDFRRIPTGPNRK